MRALLLTLLLLASLNGVGQPGNPGGPGGGKDPDVPIGGIEFLLAAGGLLGLRSIIASRKLRLKNKPH